MRLPYTSHTVTERRGTYCLLVVAYLLDLLTPELLEGTPAFIASCQTYEGGFSSASQPYYAADADGGRTLLDDIRPSLGEAHGGYTFCALASWIMLQPYLDQTQPRSTTTIRGNPSIDYRRLLRWLVQMQGSEIELGGFRGRTNKLVDGCYSWWVAGCFALLASQGVGRGGHAHDAGAQDAYPTADGEWDDVDGALLLVCTKGIRVPTYSLGNVESVWNKPALQRYILSAAQHPAAGLRDKPPKYDPSASLVPCEWHGALMDTDAERAGARTPITRCIASLGSRLLSIPSALYRRDALRSIRLGRKLWVTSHPSCFGSDAQ